MAGPSGTSKTRAARALAEFVYGDENKLITINMTDSGSSHCFYSEGSSSDMLVFVGGNSTERVSHNRYDYYY
ncbi:hypothetical protein ACLB1E_37095 [Escherichia coli]